MESLLFDHIENLQKNRTTWRLKVRVTRIWETISPENGSIRGYNLILLDDDNSHVHAYVFSDNWKVIGKDVVEGHVYRFENYTVRDTVGKLKPVSTNLCIRLLGSTIIQRVKDDGMIPHYKFEFMDLGDLEEETKHLGENENPEFAANLIGVIDKYEKVNRISTKYGPRDVVRFMLTDGRVSHKVSIWGELAIATNEAFIKAEEKPIITIVTSTKLSTFRETVQIGSLPSSKVYINLNIETVIEKGFKSPENPEKMSTKNAIIPSIERLSLKDLNDSCSTLSVKKKVCCTFKILKIEDVDNWWYYSCYKFKADVQKEGKRFRCENCKKNWTFAEKRFRLIVLAEDSTLTTNIILMDRVVKRLAGNTATHYLNKKDVRAEDIHIPDILNEIVHKELTVSIEINEANVIEDINLYEAVDLLDSSVASESCHLFDSPDSAKSVTKKPKTHA
ncbi:replication protein A 70 kDa DNA-binding subunit C-like [Apium graveolens]|uniref:replication protein A 70 kDa DNA-binding subunit C-like n=1 Tax=Apium graveolens TaxID=4045 RepID=UPI003D7BFEAE